MSTENPDGFIRRGEFYATIDPMRGDVAEIKEMVTSLAAVHSFEQGRVAAQHETAATTRDRGARRLGWAAVLGSLFAAMWWVPDAIARAFH